MPLPASMSSGLRGGGSTTAFLTGTGLAPHIGLESVFEINTNYTLINDKRVKDRYKLISVGGFDDADVRDAREVNPAAPGERPLNDYPGGRTITLTGTIETGNLRKLRDMIEYLKEAMIFNGETWLKIYSTDFAPGADVTPDTQIKVKKHQQYTITEEQTGPDFRRAFMLAFRASNPRIVAQNLIQLSYLAATTTLAVTAFTAYNAGTYAAQPIIRITGPITDPQVTLPATGGGSILFKTGTVIASGEVWTLDIEKGTLVSSIGGTNQFSKLSATSGWPDVPAAGSSVSFYGSGCTVGVTRLELDYRDTWL